MFGGFKEFVLDLPRYRMIRDIKRIEDSSPGGRVRLAIEGIIRQRRAAHQAFLAVDQFRRPGIRIPSQFERREGPFADSPKRDR